MAIGEQGDWGRVTSTGARVEIRASDWSGMWMCANHNTNPSGANTISSLGDQRSFLTTTIACPVGYKERVTGAAGTPGTAPGESNTPLQAAAGLLHVLLCDGSVRFLSEALAMQILYALGNPTTDSLGVF